MSSLNDFELTVGLEVHAQLLTRSKIFTADAVTFGKEPNRHTSLITLAHPGTLPMLNKEVITLAVRMGIACGCKIADTVTFDRKNYFYPDLPKGYQITQDKNPICRGGEVRLPNGGQVALNRIHLEEDAGKSVHDADPEMTCLDFNRAGTPLIEIVTEPCIHSSEDAAMFITEIRQILKYLKVCDGNMEEGSLRADANVSVRKKGEKQLGRKVEVKNMNSIRNLKIAIEFEFRRQAELLIEGKSILSETRLFDAERGETFPMREKEELNDYRYFPEPDLSAFVLDKTFVQAIAQEMPKTGAQYATMLMETYGLSEYDARVISSDERSVHYFLNVAEYCSDAKAISNWIIGPIRSLLNQEGEHSELPDAQKLASLIDLVKASKVSNTIAVQKLLPLMIARHDRNPSDLALENGWLLSQDDGELEDVIRDILRIYPLKIEEFKKGKKGILAMFMGEVMKRTKGKVDPKRANELLIQEINKLN
ncbi:MAG: Asp-tRNA(Asn)/Glu-tRNA(Gln) amidotransferase subunit GatB [Cyclobacteriaceae bacterium]